MPAPKKHPDERCERAVRLVRQLIDEPGLAVSRASRQVGEQLGINPDTLRNWVKRDRIDEGQIPGMTTTGAQRIAELEKENRELRRANTILRQASAYFAQAELDRRL
ncbi:transposase [Mobilicoccus sp.]|uniref:transposase n=1 Tax=Mobilicoccus sp. TaxID=2034349 RepID=UPI0028B0F59F|nr:transposase [Mobilicoccus sp.]